MTAKLMFGKVASNPILFKKTILSNFEIQFFILESGTSRVVGIIKPEQIESHTVGSARFLSNITPCRPRPVCVGSSDQVCPSRLITVGFDTFLARGYSAGQH
jgi:hypothetical protein